MATLLAATPPQLCLLRPFQLLLRQVRILWHLSLPTWIAIPQSNSVAVRSSKRDSQQYHWQRSNRNPWPWISHCATFPYWARCRLPARSQRLHMVRMEKKKKRATTTRMRTRSKTMMWLRCRRRHRAKPETLAKSTSARNARRRSSER